MALRLIEMVLQEKDGAELRDLLKEHQVLEHRQLRLPDGEVLVRILLDAERNEAVLDLLENRYTGEAGNRVVVLPVEATLPRADSGLGIGRAGVHHRCVDDLDWGVMVALAMGALSLFLMDLICVNLAGVTTFLVQGIRPDT